MFCCIKIPRDVSGCGDDSSSRIGLLKSSGDGDGVIWNGDSENSLCNEVNEELGIVE